MNDADKAAVPQPAPAPAPEISAPVELEKVLPPWLAEAIAKKVAELVPQAVGDYFLAHPPPPLGLKDREELDDHVEKLAAEIVQAAADQSLALSKEYTDNAIKSAAAEITAKLTELLTPIVAKSAELAKSPALTREQVGEPYVVGGPPHVLAAGDRVKVWADAQKQNFHTGTVELAHEGGAKFDVSIDGLGVSTIPVDGLEYDPLG